MIDAAAVTNWEGRAIEYRKGDEVRRMVVKGQRGQSLVGWRLRRDGRLMRRGGRRKNGCGWTTYSHPIVDDYTFPHHFIRFLTAEEVA